MSDTPPAGMPLSALHDRAACWFDRAQASLCESLPCRRGCSACCIGPFAITVLDAALLQQGLAALDPPVRAAVQERARCQTAELERAYPSLKAAPLVDGWTDAERDALAERFGDRPCPALGAAGECLVYPFRPVTCRTMGIPPDIDGVVEGACRVQTAVPVVRLPPVLWKEEECLAEMEAVALEAFRRVARETGEEMWLAYGFLPAHGTTLVA